MGEEGVGESSLAAVGSEKRGGVVCGGVVAWLQAAATLRHFALPKPPLGRGVPALGLGGFPWFICLGTAG